MTASTRQLAGIVGAAVVVAASVGAGLLPIVTSVIGVLGVCACGMLVLTVLGVRRTLPSRHSEERADHGHVRPGAALRLGEEQDSEVGSLSLRLARVLFYVGSVLVGQSAFRWAAGLTLSEAMFIASFALCVFSVLRGNPIVGIPTPVVAAVGIFVVGGSISSLDAQSPTGSGFQVVHAAYTLLLWPCVGVMVLRTRRQLMTTITLWSISAAIDGLDAIFQVIGVHVIGPARAGNRMTGLTENPNDLGGVTSIALVPALLTAARSVGDQRHLFRAVRWLPVALIATGLVLSGSVAGMAAGGVALLVWLSAPAVRAPARVAVIAALVCALAVVALSDGKVTSPLQRLAQVTSPASTGVNGSGQDRISVIQQAWPRIESDPFVGTGLDVYDTDVTIISHAYSVRYQIHGLPIAAWYETGIFGVAGLIGLLVALAMIGWRSARAAATDDDLLVAWALVAGFVAFVIEAMTQPMVFQQYGWITAVLLIAWNGHADFVPAPLRRGEFGAASDTQTRPTRWRAGQLEPAPRGS